MPGVRSGRGGLRSTLAKVGGMVLAPGAKGAKRRGCGPLAGVVRVTTTTSPPAISRAIFSGNRQGESCSSFYIADPTLSPRFVTVIREGHTAPSTPMNAEDEHAGCCRVV
jgi:hypothetical protein